MHHPWSTYLGQHQCEHSICIFDFYYEIYTYYVLKSICIIKGHWWSLTLSWPDDDQGMIYCFLKRNEKNPQIYCLLFLLNRNWFTYLFYSYHLHDYMLLYAELIVFLYVKFMVIPIHHWAHVLLTLLLYSFYRLVIIFFVSNGGVLDLLFFVALWLGSYA